MRDSRNIPSSPTSSPTGNLGQSNNCEWDLSLTLGWLLMVSHTRVEARARLLEPETLVDHYLEIGLDD